MEKEVILLVIGAVISLASSLITTVFNYRLSRRQWQEQQQYEAQKELRKNLTSSLEDVRRQGLGPLRGGKETNQDTEILPLAIANLEVEKKGLIQALKNLDTPSLKIKNLLNLALEIDKTGSD